MGVEVLQTDQTTVEEESRELVQRRGGGGLTPPVRVLGVKARGEGIIREDRITIML